MQFSHSCVCSVPRKGLKAFLSISFSPCSLLDCLLFLSVSPSFKDSLLSLAPSFALRRVPPSAENFTVSLSAEIIYSTPPTLSKRIDLCSLRFCRFPLNFPFIERSPTRPWFFSLRTRVQVRRNGWSGNKAAILWNLHGKLSKHTRLSP